MTLREQVARAIDAAFDANEPLDQWELALLEADAALGVVLAAVRAELEALPYVSAGRMVLLDAVTLEEVLAVLARLGGDMDGGA